MKYLSEVNKLKGKVTYCPTDNKTLLDGLCPLKPPPNFLKKLDKK
jgi:hypothetical protein